MRIAGVEVGKVISTSRDGNATTVTFTVDGAGRPIHDDAFAAIRPRIFLEGNFFVELDPGSPSAPDIDSGATIPVSHTSTAVQLDEVLTALQSPIRADLSRLLESYGTALTHKPTAAEDATQLPEVRGKTGAEALNGALKYGGDAGRYSAQVTNAFLGTQQRDLSRLVAGAGRTFGAFASRESDLQGLIDNFNVFTGALAAQSTNLSTTIHLLAPTLRTAHASLVSLNRTLPPLRTYAIELTPAVAELPGLISASKPWLAQVRPLLSGKEGGGVARLLAESTPGLAGAAQAGKEVTLPQLNRLSLCTTKVLVPTGNQTIERPLQHRRSQLPRVPLQPRQLRRLRPELRRQRPLRPRQGRRRPAPGRRTEPAGQQEHLQRPDQLRPHDRAPDRHPAAARRHAAAEAGRPLLHEPRLRRQRRAWAGRRRRRPLPRG